MAGQIIKRGDRTWLVRIFLGRDAKSKQKFHHKTVYGTKRDAECYLTAARREMDLGVFVELSAMSVSEYLDRWLRDAARVASHSRGLRWIVRAVHPRTTWLQAAG